LGIEKWEYDQRREAQLRRAGWKFWRVSGSAFYRNKEKVLEGLWKYVVFLLQCCIINTT
jgi:very-short-patch-repair endonuclease